MGGNIAPPLKRAIKRLAYAGRRRRCPVCGRSARTFLPGGVVSRPEALCPFCGSLERHRLAWLFFSQRTNLFDSTPKRMLHIAPEEMFESRLRRLLGPGYLTADLLDPRVMERMDITDIRHPDGTFDVVYCAHVLEHVPDDRKAMREFVRVLKPAGWALLMVPVTAERTVEDPAIADPAERLRLFGQEDHVRRYGPDFEQRLCEAGFTVQRISSSDLCDDRQMGRFRIPPKAAGDLYYCTKAPADPAGSASAAAGQPRQR